MSVLAKFRCVIRDPLVHFLLAGGVVFALLSAMQPTAERPRQIVVNDETLVLFLQYRNKSFQSDKARASLAAMSAEERQTLADEFVREEVLFREAQRLGLAESDYMIRLRLVQKMEFALQDFAEAETVIDDAELQSFYLANKARYAEPGRLTFTHVFISAERWGEEALARAEALRQRLNEQGVTAREAGGFGDRFPYHRYYVERSDDYLAGHFGRAFVEQLWQLPMTEKEGSHWSMPLRSEFGYHLVLLSKREMPRQPGFAELRERLLADYRRQRARENQQRAISSLIDRYQRIEG
ncbi:peptidyl-prolyl cis-trans isomerase [Microbulbifer hainanensis]|uniref:peptidylprolyl isomerase n=1 Tax=Microbulbifer hainanensis TaxID=2735675 RepID=UPI00186844FB|nr:peptidylprolyl isomerase [Microbulbifer hainanensis]